MKLKKNGDGKQCGNAQDQWREQDLDSNAGSSNHQTKYQSQRKSGTNKQWRKEMYPTKCGKKHHQKRQRGSKHRQGVLTNF